VVSLRKKGQTKGTQIKMGAASTVRDEKGRQSLLLKGGRMADIKYSDSTPVDEPVEKVQLKSPVVVSALMESPSKKPLKTLKIVLAEAR